jgi:hypothetical protein
MKKPSIDVAEPEVMFRKNSALTPEQQAAIIAEDSAPLESLTEEQKKRRYQREAKRKERKKKAEANAEANAAKMEDAIRKADSKLTIQKFWERNRGRLDEATRATYLERQATVMEFVEWMWRWLHGYQEDAEFFQTDRNDMEAFIREHGTHHYYDLSQKPDGGYENRLRAEVFFYKNDDDDGNDRKWRAIVASDPFEWRTFLATGLMLSLPSELVTAFNAKFPKESHATTPPATS